MAEAVDELSHASNAMKRKVDLQTEKGDGQPLMALRVQTPAKRQRRVEDGTPGQKILPPSRGTVVDVLLFARGADDHQTQRSLDPSCQDIARGPPHRLLAKAEWIKSSAGPLLGVQPE